MKLGEQENKLEFLVDTGATFSVLNQALLHLDESYVSVVGATGQTEKAYFFKPLKYKYGKTWGLHKFLYMPNAPKSLLGRDLLEALGAEIKFNKGKVEFRVREEQLVEVLSLALMSPQQEKDGIKESIKDQVYPGVWDTEQPGRAKNALPVIIDLKPGAQPVRLKQYPLRKEDREGVLPIVEKFLKYGLLTECESAYNTPILPVRKPAGGYRLVQDLRAINKITKDIHPVVANPYTLLTQLRTELGWFTVLDLKDAFFCLPLAPESQPLFAFEWENPETNRKCQLTWTVLPQGFKNSPTVFGNQLAKELEKWNRPEGNGALLQYVDDILLATQTRAECESWTVSMLNFLGLHGYRVSPQKAQIVQQQVTYLGYELTAGQRVLGPERKEAICSIPLPNTVKALRTFLGMTGWCRLWIYNYGLLVKPLYELLKETDKDLQWNGEAEQAFRTLKKELMRAPALGLPDVTKPFLLYSHESQGIALGVLAQTLGPYRRAVAYLSKQLDEVSKGWPGCLRAVAAVAINIQESRKFTMGQKITVLVSHTISAVLEAKGGHWLSPQRFLKYQAILVEQDDVEIKVANFVNPASFLQGGDGEPVIHDCLETIEATYSSRPDLKEEPLEKADHNWYTDGSSFVIQGERKAGYAVTTGEEMEHAKTHWGAEALYRKLVQECIARKLYTTVEQISFRKPSGAQVDRTISGVIDILHSHQNQGTSCLDSPHQSQEDFSKRMETRISGTPEAQAVSIIVICLLVNTIEGWEGNMYLNVSQELALQTNLSNCWICTELPRGQMRTPLFGVASMNWTWGPSDWVTTSDSNFHNCQHGKDSSERLGPKFDLLIVDPSRTLFVESNESSENKVGWRNLTGLGCSWNYSSPGEVSGANPWVQGNGCTSSKESRLDVVGAGVALLSQISCLLPYGYWWLCGDGHARKSLPPKWTGVCTAGYLTPQITVHHEILPRGYWRTLWRRHRRTANPLVRYNTGYHSFVRALFPALGVAQLEKAIVNISATMEVIANSAADAVQNLQVEVKSVSSVSLQNRLALDIITAEMGGVCTLINTTCCTYVDRSGQIKTDVQNIWEQGKVLHEVSKDDTSYGLSDLWEELTSWMPNIRWLKQLLLGIVMIVLLIILLLVLIEIIMCTGKSSVESYHKYKNYTLRHELETGHYFKKI
ncbi:uncharacterized protein [Melanerpes formicivorus]|uniref:uncharacterized protein isoform X2 n=1 Tax=Melanerpes formicivorus TaxID=211600 RepID=UPI00358F02FB